MTDTPVKQIQNCASPDSVTIVTPGLPNHDAGSTTEPSENSFKSVSKDSGETEVVKKSSISSSGSFKRRSIRRRSSKRLSKPEPEFGHDTKTYEKIQERVLQERAVTNAIDALQERWRMIMFMYDDCVELNEQRRELKLRKLCVQRQFELILIISIFMLICIPISVVIVLINR
ncbi:uncharacterized protein LOC128547556 [Mercenaria mercenaria]|uniref:uncharacterized protein LOC128547556 n=1 Tax=Mercenaria mercenaria TaxID=6596 RepID=UPI00234E74D4|nr:uncharacterized protein LOC128547556 [Mercenaria mercenaria]